MAVALDAVLGVVAARVAAIVGGDVAFARCGSRCETGAPAVSAVVCELRVAVLELGKGLWWWWWLSTTLMGAVQASLVAASRSASGGCA